LAALTAVASSPVAPIAKPTSLLPAGFTEGGDLAFLRNGLTSARYVKLEPVTMANNEIVLIGVGEIGGVFARGFLRLGYSVHPVTRDTDLLALSQRVTDPDLVVVAVGETSLRSVLSGLPAAWKDRLCLLQNELLPSDWRGIPSPTVISIWFEKKPGMDAKVIIPSPVQGPGAGLVGRALAAVGIPTLTLDDDRQLLAELVVKNLYILTTNIAGLDVGGTVDELWRHHRALAMRVAGDVLRLQEKLTGERFDHAALIERMLAAFAGDPAHKCMGRSAPARLDRALEHAERLQCDVPELRRIAGRQSLRA